MSRLPYRLLIILAAGVILIAAILATSWFVGSPGQGKTLARIVGLPRPAIIAHRGASYLAPEETRAAYLLARELGADYLEFDVQRTKDGVLVALHDETLSRTSDVANIFPGRDKDTVDTFTFLELQQLDIGQWFNQRFPERSRKAFQGLRVLRVEDILEIVEAAPPEVGIYIETKSAHRFPGIESQLVEQLRQRGWIGHLSTSDRTRLIFQSFDPESLKKLKQLAPEVPRLLLVDEVLMAKLGWDGVLKIAAEVAMGIGTWGTGWAFGPDWSQSAGSRYVTTWPWYTGEAHRSGLFVHPWTIDEAWEMWVVRAGGADGIFTNRCDVALRAYGRSLKSDIESLWRQIGY